MLLLRYRGRGQSLKDNFCKILSFFRNCNPKSVLVKPLPVKRGFSVAEAMITLLIVSIFMAASAPLMTKTYKQSVRQVEVQQPEGGGPAGAIMFFELSTCPEGWEPVSADLENYYPRITAQENNDQIGTTMEQMVHRHKHVSPIMAPRGQASKGAINIYRYGPGSIYDVGNLAGVSFDSVKPSSGFLFTSDGMNGDENIYNGNSLLTSK